MTSPSAPVVTGGRLLDDVDRRAAHDPAGLAAVCVDSAGAEHTLTWGELSADSHAVARRLRALGVAPGDPVAYQLPNRIEFLTTTLAVLRLGATCMPLMPSFRERELAFMLAEARTRVLLVPDVYRGHDHAALAAGLQRRLAALEHVIVAEDYADLCDEVNADRADRAGRAAMGQPDPGEVAQQAQPDLDPGHIAQLLFTSGSTGEPKGVLNRHDTLIRAADVHTAHFGLTADDVIYVPSPLAHQTGFLYGMWIALRLGATQVVSEHWDADGGFQAMRRHGVTFVQAATPFLADLTRVASEREQTLPSLRTFVATGAAIPRELARRARVALGAEVGGAFGTTESCLGAAFVPGLDDERSWTTDGRALANVTLRIVDDDGHELPPGTEGNFEIATDTLFEGYLNRPQATAEAVTADGYYRPGDLATLDADGYLRITGRVRDVINRGGEKVPVAEIEQLLYRHPAVRDAAIVAMPDPRLGERACAFVVLAAGARLTFAQMQDHLDAHRVAKPYWPERLELVAELPRTPSGKIQKFLLRDRAREFTDVHRKAGA